MIEFLKVLFFAKTVLLTSSPIDVGLRPIDIDFDEPVVALTSGAGIEIDISRMIDRKQYKNIREIRNYVDAKIPKGAISARLLSDQNETVLRYQGNVGVSETRVYVSLEPEGKMSTNKEFSRLIMKSDVELSEVRIFWRNYRK